MEKLDEIDYKIVAALQENARISFADLGRQVNMTAPAVAGRIRRLEDTGIISGYHARIDAAALGNGLTVFIHMSVAYQRETSWKQFLGRCPEVVEGYIISGKEMYLLKVCAKSTEHLNQLLGQLIHYGQPTISVVLGSVPVKAKL